MVELNPTQTVLVLDAEGNNLGQMRVREARILASEQELDLIVVSQTPSTTVCKIMDRGKWKYEQSKKERAKHQKAVQTKEIKFHINTEQHDINTKTNHIQNFLTKGHSVRVVVEMKGRDKIHTDLAQEKLKKVIETFGDSIKVDPIKVFPGGGSSPATVSTTIQPAVK